MGRLLDELVSELEADPPLQSVYRAATAILADNVARYYFQGAPRVEWDLSRDLPNIAPPLDTFWVEVNAPETIKDEKGIHHPWAATWLRRWGALFQGVDLLSPERPSLGGWDRLAVRTPGARWLLKGALCLQTHRRSLGSIGGISAVLDGQGRVVTTEGGPLLRFQCAGALDGHGYEEHILDLFTPLLLTISFLHCKNVEMVEVRPKAPSWAAPRRQRARPGLVRYHVLEIEPMRRVLRSEGQAEEKGLARAIHICRGHFKDYRARGLFGRSRGIYWWDAHVRGDARRGIVRKDYEMGQIPDDPPTGD